ncbi:MAG: protoporphyrinogen oxidase [Halolamina sp.]|uniref:protoporphyrinogen oxidase n=1 Tax=Halolamina sp. TaxID=1940283 RepID=UPI002FC30919
MKIGIVGAGLTGLALQQYLTPRGTESVVFESSAEPGGVIRSRTVDGRTLEFGPQRTRLSPPVASLVGELGIGDQRREADDGPLFVYRDGALRRVPFSIGDAVATDLLSVRGKLRLLLEPLTDPPRAGETVEESLTRTLGAEAAEYLVGPLYGGIYGSHPDEMEMEYSLLRALDTYGVDRSLLAAALRGKLGRSDPSPVVSFDGGMQALPRAIYERHRNRIHLDTPVEAVRDLDDRFGLETASGMRIVDRVVLTTPADVTATLLDAIAPAAASELRRLTYNPLALVHLVPETTMDATGFQVQYEEAFRTLGVTCNADLFDRDDHYTVFLGGARTPGLVDWSTSEIRETARREFSELTGVAGRVVNVHRLRRGMPAYDTSWSALDRVETPTGVQLSGNYVSRAGIPGRIGEAKQLAERASQAAANGSEPR